ncbi:putative endonuclease lcl3 [Binucleata daphniae]
MSKTGCFICLYYKYLLVMLLVLIVLIILIIFVRKNNKRYRKIEDLPKKCINLVLKGIVTRICDGDGFYFYHTNRKKVKKNKKGICVRIAGIDAPEVQKYGIPAQPFAKEAKQFLSSLILNKTVYIKILGIDIYNRVLASVCIQNVNVGLECVKNGFACVFEGKNAVYGGMKQKMIKYEANARAKKLNMWSNKQNITPMEYKRNNK